MDYSNTYDTFNISNTICKYCNKRFNETFEPLVVCKECGIICHEKCYKQTDINKVCHLNSQIHESEIEKYSKQKQIDVLSLKRTSYKPSIKDYFRGIFFRIPYLFFHFSLLYLDNVFGFNSSSRFIKFLDAVAYGLNINSKIINKNKLINSKVIYVSNHVSFHDALTLPRYFFTGYMASITTQKHFIFNILRKYANLLFVERGKNDRKISIIQQINDFVDKKGNILICPQGLLGKYNSISKFRSSAFRTKYPIQPIVLKYKQDVSSMSSFNIIFYDRVDIEVHVMDPQYIKENETPEEFSERVRQNMAKECDLMLSNVDSHDIRD